MAAVTFSGKEVAEILASKAGSALGLCEKDFNGGLKIKITTNHNQKDGLISVMVEAEPSTI